MLLRLAILAASVAISFLGPPTSIALGASNSVPPNYRQLVARRILENTNWKIRGGRISGPHEQWVGILAGGFRPVVCAVVIRDNLLTAMGANSPAHDVWVISFQDGRIYTAGYSNSECKATQPFNEIVGRR
jgi:hypothetical protein